MSDDDRYSTLGYTYFRYLGARSYVDYFWNLIQFSMALKWLSYIILRGLMNFVIQRSEGYF